jgi:Galactose oxidase, central domain
VVTRALGLIAAVLLSGCAPKVVDFQVKIVTTSCDAASDPFAGARYITVRVTGEGISPPKEANSEAASRTISLPEIPAGPARTLQVRVYGADGPGSKVLAWGQSLPFDVPDLVPEAKPPEISVFLRKVDTFTPLAAASSPKDCEKMKLPRAGHTATLLKSGKVFVAGGFRFKEGTTERIALADTELYNPATGAFESARSMSVSTQVLPNAFHSATMLQNGTVLLWGGEQYLGGAANLPAPRATALIYYDEQNNYRAVKSRTTPRNIVRSRHGAAIDKHGLVLIAGGMSRDGQGQLVPAGDVEWYDPTLGETFVIDTPGIPRFEPAVASVQGGSLIAIAGGSDGGITLRDVSYFGYDGTVFRATDGGGPELKAARRGAGVATARNGDDLLLFGGYGEATNVSPLSSTEVVGTRSNSVGDGPNVGARGESCVATLPDGTMIVIGGRTVDALGQPPHSDANVTVVKPAAGGGFTSSIGPSLSVARYSHTCTTLADGAVLVLGGIRETGGTAEVLQDALIFQPAPMD